jgi:hypothetical protein
VRLPPDSRPSLNFRTRPHTVSAPLPRLPHVPIPPPFKSNQTLTPPLLYLGDAAASAIEHGTTPPRGSCRPHSTSRHRVVRTPPGIRASARPHVASPPVASTLNVALAASLSPPSHSRAACPPATSTVASASPPTTISVLSTVVVPGPLHVVVLGPLRHHRTQSSSRAGRRVLGGCWLIIHHATSVSSRSERFGARRSRSEKSRSWRRIALIFLYLIYS